MNEAKPKPYEHLNCGLWQPTKYLEPDSERIARRARERADKVIDDLLERQRKDAELAAGCYTHDYGDE